MVEPNPRLRPRSAENPSPPWLVCLNLDFRRRRGRGGRIGDSARLRGRGRRGAAVRPDVSAAPAAGVGHGDRRHRSGLDGRIGIVTGASSGIGHAVSLRLADAGAGLCLVAASEDQAALEALADAGTLRLWAKRRWRHNGGRAVHVVVRAGLERREASNAVANGALRVEERPRRRHGVPLLRSHRHRLRKWWKYR
jgi:hypothetical protein